MPSEIIVQGRIVRGHPGVKRPVVDDTTKKQKVNERGEPRESIFFGVAVAKDIFLSQYWPAFYAEAMAAFPGGVPATFAYKFVDGDTGVDGKGKPLNTREGYAGHYVINYSTEGFPPPVYKQRPNSTDYDQVPVEQVNCGDFVAVTTTLKSNGNSGTRKPGLYVNPSCIMFLGYGNKIVSNDVDPKEKFAGFQAQQFQGMSQQPLMPTGAMPAAMHGAPPGNGYAPAAGAMPPGGMPNAAPVGHYQQPAPTGAPMNPGYPPQGQPQPMQNYAPQPQPVQQPYPQHGAPLPQPAHDFVQNAVGAPPQGYAGPQQVPVQHQTPQYSQPGAMPQQPYPAQPMQPQGQSYPPQQPQPYGAPGMMPGMPQGR